jgi:hypothetical protein
VSVPLLVVDGDSLAHRAYHALPPMTRPDGVPINAVYGFCRMLVADLLDKPEVDHIAMILDAGEVTFRNEIYAEYKANRSTSPGRMNGLTAAAVIPYALCALAPRLIVMPSSRPARASGPTDIGRGPALAGPRRSPSRPRTGHKLPRRTPRWPPQCRPWTASLCSWAWWWRW